MKKDILSINFEIPWYSDNFRGFTSNKSLMDTDILIYKTENPWYDYSNSTYQWLYSYAETPSFEYKKNIRHWKKEINDFLNLWKTVFIIWISKEEFYLQSWNKTYSWTWRNQKTTNIVDLHNNYEFLPFNIWNIVKANWNKINHNWELIFSNFLDNFKNYIEYQNYIQNISQNWNIIYEWKDKNKILWAYYKEWKWFLVFLPEIDYSNSEFTYEKDTKIFWNEDWIKFGKMLIDFFIKADKYLFSEWEKTITPNWVDNKKFQLDKEKELNKAIKQKEKEIIILNNQKTKLEKEVLDNQSLKDLLFEQWKPLEDAVIEALELLWYKAENYDDWELELDQIIISPEKNRYIWECEWKDNKAINITKYRQLLEWINRDFWRDDVEEKAFWILFWNPERLTELWKRKTDFTDKCKKWAKWDNIALIKTEDLYIISKYLKENKNEKFKKSCRKTIHDWLWWLIVFPKIPK